jgi:hypothetical protein
MQPLLMTLGRPPRATEQPPQKAVREAGRVLQSSPLYGLLQSHMARLCHTPDALAQGPTGTLLGNATIDLVRAMIASTGPAESRRRAATITNETTHAQIITYLRAHLLSGPSYAIPVLGQSRSRVTSTSRSGTSIGCGPTGTHFSCRFRETYGTSPDEWRRANSPGRATPR